MSNFELQKKVPKVATLRSQSPNTWRKVAIEASMFIVHTILKLQPQYVALILCFLFIFAIIFNYVIPLHNCRSCLLSSSSSSFLILIHYTYSHNILRYVSLKQGSGFIHVTWNNKFLEWTKWVFVSFLKGNVSRIRKF